MICTNCNTKAEGNDVFCGECGSKLAANVANVATPPPPVQNIPQPVQETPPHTKIGIVASIASVLVCMVIGILLIVFFSVYTVRSALSVSSIGGILEDTDIGNIRVGRMLNLDGDAYQRDITLSNWILGELDTSVVDRYSITRRNIDNLLNHPRLQAFAEDIISRYAQGLLGGHNAYISTREIMNFINRNEHLLYNELGVELTNRDMAEIENFLEENDIQTMSSLDHILEDVDLDMSLVHRGLSVLTLVLLAVIIVLFMSLVFFLCKMRFSQTFIRCGIAIIVSGAVFTIFMFASNTLVIRIIPVEIDSRLVDMVLGNFRGTGVVSGVVAMCVGIVFVIASLATSIIQEKRSGRHAI